MFYGSQGFQEKLLSSKELVADTRYEYEKRNWTRVNPFRDCKKLRLGCLNY